ncbi:hypothetical protein E2K99_11545 [Herbaspirillum huttiense]|nr:hypothetical protein E2K99_11545 [Herbaspirillum huttiense]
MTVRISRPCSAEKALAGMLRIQSGISSRARRGRGRWSISAGSQRKWICGEGMRFRGDMKIQGQAFARNSGAMGRSQ